MTLTPLLIRNSVEICNSRDDDCNGQIDENAVDATLFYIDSDGDGRRRTLSNTLGLSAL